MAQRFAGQTVYITGAASGIARSVAQQVAAEGGRIGICDRNADGAAQTAELLKSAGAEAAWATADVTQLPQLTAAFAELERALGPPHGVLACAGITGTTLLDQLAPARDELLFQINLLGVARTLDAARPGLLRAGGGWFAGVSSLVALRGLPFTAAYCGSKSAVAEYLEALRPWLADEEIRLTVVFPGYVRTPLTEAGAVKPPIRMLEPEEAARYIVGDIAARRKVSAFPRGLAFGIRLLRWMSAQTYDKTMKKAAQKITHLKY